MLDMTQSMQVTMEYEAQDVLISNGRKTMMPNFGLGTRLGMVNFALGKTGLKKRRFPLETDYACGVQENMVINYDENLGEVVSLPTHKPIDNERMIWKRTVENGGGTVKTASTFKPYFSRKFSCRSVLPASAVWGDRMASTSPYRPVSRDSIFGWEPC